MTASIKVSISPSHAKVAISDLAIAIRKRGDAWIAYSPSLNNTLGYSKESEQDAKKAFKRSLGVFFQIHIEDKTLDGALAKFGWEKIEEPVFTFPKELPTLKKESLDFDLAMAA